MTTTRRIAAATALAAIFALGVPAAAYAEGSTGTDFGQHVRDCAQTMGFTGQHNPGMHDGYAGWDGMTCDH